MEAFLSTLPPYVHDFLGKHPPTDVFNLLKELVCFAVLYSNDREQISSSTNGLLKKNQNQAVAVIEEEEAVVPEPHTMIEPIKEETEIEIKDSPAQEVIEKPTYNIRTGELIQKDNKSKMPNTFPEWWGHQESEPQHVVPSNTRKEESHNSKPVPESYGTSWISWDTTPADTNTNHHRLERARSQIIPDLRSYPEEDNTRMSNSHTSPVISSTPKRHSTVNLKSSTSSVRSTNPTTSPPPTTKASRRISAPVCEFPTSGTGQSKFVLTATKQQQLREANSKSPTNKSPTNKSPTNKSPTNKSPTNSKSSTNSTGTTTRSASVVIKQPRENAAMRARAEHARLQQEEFAKKKSTTPLASSTSLRLKQRVNSGIDWESIKRDRRNTVAAEPVSTKKD